MKTLTVPAIPEKITEKQRTDQQNRALHLYFQMIADDLNEAGLDIRKVLKPEIEIPWNKDLVKDYLWRPIQEIYLKKKSTTQLITTDIDIIFEIFNRHIAKFGIHEDFPSLERFIDAVKAKLD